MPGYKLSDIEETFQLLLKRLRNLYIEKKKLEQKILMKDQEIIRQQNQIKEYEESMHVLRMTTSSEDTESNVFRKEVRTTINNYIKEIDNCIAILNK